MDIPRALRVPSAEAPSALRHFQEELIATCRDMLNIGWVGGCGLTKGAVPTSVFHSLDSSEWITMLPITFLQITYLGDII